MSFNYFDALVDNNIIAIDDYERIKNEVAICKGLENHMKTKNSNIELIRKFIIMSYRFDKSDLSFLDRYNYIRGLLYSSQYASYDGFVEDLEDLVEDDMELIDSILSSDAVETKIFTGEENNADYYKGYLYKLLYRSAFNVPYFFKNTESMSALKVNLVLSNGSVQTMEESKQSDSNNVSTSSEETKQNDNNESIDSKEKTKQNNDKKRESKSKNKLLSFFSKMRGNTKKKEEISETDLKEEPANIEVNDNPVPKKEEIENITIGDETFYVGDIDLSPFATGEVLNLPDLTVAELIGEENTIFKKYIMMIRDYDDYASDVLFTKSIVEEDSDEYKMVTKGMNDHFTYILNLYINSFIFYLNYYKKHSKNLGLNI